MSEVDISISDPLYIIFIFTLPYESLIINYSTKPHVHKSPPHKCATARYQKSSNIRDGMDVTLKHFPNFSRKKEAAAKISKWHRPPVHSWRMVEWLMHTPTGESAIHNPVHYPRKVSGERVKAHYNQYRRLEWDKQARCLTQNNGVISSLACVHPGNEYIQGVEKLYSEPRVFTIYEILIISSLPLDWPIPEWANESLIRRVIGEGVPSRLIKVIMENLIRRI